jgi:hypothetical protein
VSVRACPAKAGPSLMGWRRRMGLWLMKTIFEDLTHSFH